MKLTVLSKGGCQAGDCPTIYKSDRGTFVIQGEALSSADLNIEMRSHEGAVEIPEQLILEVARQLVRS